MYLDEPAINKVYKVRAGKYRRYSGLKWYQRLFDIKTFLLNIRDVFRTMMGYVESRRLIRELEPDIMLVKGGFVAVPMGLAASRSDVPFITHDSDSTPGLANRIISRWATVHATGMPKELYSYPGDKTVYTGIPVSAEFKKVTPSLRTGYRDEMNLGGASSVITIVGGSQGAGQLNEDIVHAVAKLSKTHKNLGVVHVAGASHEKSVAAKYKHSLSEAEARFVSVKGFVSNVYACQGAADIVVTRAGATAMSELSLQGLPVVIVPGQLAGGHQDKNAEWFSRKRAAVVVPHADSDGLYTVLDELLGDRSRLKQLGSNLYSLAKPNAARELAELVIDTAKVA